MNNKAVERIKSAVIVVLFLTTILLLYLVLGGSATVKLSDIISLPGRGGSAPEASTVVLPEYVAYSAGDGSFSLSFGESPRNTRLTSKQALTEEGIESFRAMSQQGSMLASEITSEQYVSALTGYESVFFSFPYSIPFADFCEGFGIKFSGTMSNVDSLSAFGFSGAAPGSVLLVDSQNSKFYRLLSDSAASGDEGEKPVPCANAVFSNEKYYFAEAVFGVGGRRLIAIGQADALLPAVCEPEIDKANEEARIELAKKVFGDTFDFVRRIEDGFGNYTYMYGYGAKTLTLTAGGGMEYKTESAAGRSGGWFKDLEAALEYIESVGGWAAKGDTHFELSSAQTFFESGKTIRRFGFSQYMGGAEIFSGQGGDAISVTIENGKLVQYSRSAVKASFAAMTEDRLPMDAVNTIAAGSPSQEEFNFVAENYESIRKSYLVLEGELRPVWRLVIRGGGESYYDLYTGEALILSAERIEE